MKQITAIRTVLCSLFTTSIVIDASLQIPLPNFDYFTLQFFFVLTAGMLLGACLGTLSAALYVPTGLFDILVFAAGGGISYVLCPSSGSLLDSIVTAFCSGWVMQYGQRKWKTCFLAVLTGLLATHEIGLAYKYMILNHHTGTEISSSLLLLSCSPLDLPKDILRSIPAAYVTLCFPMVICRDIEQERVYIRQIQK